MATRTLQASTDPADTIKKIGKFQVEPAREAWEHFVNTGQFLKRTPRSVISQSWLKSRENGIDPHKERAETILCLEEIEHKLQCEQLGQASLPLLHKLVSTFDGSRHVMVLADANGHILHSVGHREIQYHLDKINFMPGGSWAEKDVGPNGIGTPLSRRKPEVVFGPEHYCKSWQPWVCYGAPVFDRHGQDVLGVIDVTGPIEEACPETMLLTISTAQSIQQGILALGFARREKLRVQARELIRRWHSEALLLIDEDGYVIDCNSRIDRYFNNEYQDVMERQLSMLIPDIWETIHSRIFKKSCGQISVDIKNNFGVNRPVQVHIEPVIYDGEPLGAVLILTGHGATAPKNGLVQKTGPQTKYTFEHIRGHSDSLRKTVKLAKAAAYDPMENNVLLVGETGTGKELIAHSIHAESDRRPGPFIAVNCGAIPQDLIESELFGYVAGAFTGARREGKTGKFEAAQNGTLFLDEIDSLDFGMQAKFLRVLDNKEISRLGSNNLISVNVRIIAAASKELHHRIDEGGFRMDLYHRLSVIEIPIPALRERGQDIIDLANEFLEKECWSANRGKLVLSQEVKPLLSGYPWPGNVRELYNLCLRWVLTVDRETVGLEHLPDRMRNPVAANVPLNISDGDNLKSINDELITRTLERVGGNVSRAARTLGINRATIYRRIKNQAR